MFLNISNGVKILSEISPTDKSTKLNIMWGGITCFLGVILAIALNKASDAWTEQTRIQNQTLMQVTKISVQMESADFKSMRGDITKNQFDVKLLQQEIERLKHEINISKDIYQ